MSVKERAWTATLNFAVQGKKRGALTAVDAVNCDCKDGVLRASKRWRRLKKGNGAEDVCDVSNPRAIGYARALNTETQAYDTRMWILAENGDFYYRKDENSGFTLTLRGLEGADVFSMVAGDEPLLCLLADGRCALMKGDGTVFETRLKHSCAGGAFFKHRLFVGVAPSDIVYSFPEMPSDFTEREHGGGRFRLSDGNGKIVAMKGFGEKLYLFFESALMVLDGAGAAQDFKVRPIPYAGGKIFGRSVVVGNKAMYFLATDGVYRFNGKQCERLFFDRVKPPARETGLTAAAAAQGKVFIRYQTQENEAVTLLFYEDGDDCFYMDEMTAMSSEMGGMVVFIDENKYFCCLDENGDLGAKGHFVGAETDFGIAGRKTVTKLRFFGEGEFTFTMKNGGRVLKRTVVFENGQAEVRMSERGESFVFDFALEKGAKIEKIVAQLRSQSKI